MKNLIYKEFKLCIGIFAYIVPLLCALLLIPNWVYPIAFMYTLFITVPTMFTICKEQRDQEFSVLLPVRKRDIVKARYISIAILELIHILAGIVFAVISNLLYPQGNAWLMDPNVAFFGIVYITYALFNFVFLTMFYKTAVNIAMPLTIATIVAVAFATAAEFFIQAVPALRGYLDGFGAAHMASQLPALAAGILIYIVSMVLSYKISYKRFEKIDL